MSHSTPIVFIIFRRPDLTVGVFDATRQTQPKKLLVVADGLRNEDEAEAQLCQQACSVTKEPLVVQKTLKTLDIQGFSSKAQFSQSRFSLPQALLR